MTTSRGVQVAQTPVELVAGLSLEEDQLYIIQNKSDYRLHIIAQAATPNVDLASVIRNEQIIEGYKTGTVKPESATDKFWCYYRGEGSGVVSAVEAP